MRVVRACPASVLSANQKLIWEEHALLCNDRHGATIGAGSLARRLGLDARTIERTRAEFVRWGLLCKQDRGAGRTPSWFVTLPHLSQPGHQRITDDEAITLAERLAEHIRGFSSRTPVTSSGGRSHIPSQSQPPLTGGPRHSSDGGLSTFSRMGGEDGENGTDNQRRLSGDNYVEVIPVSLKPLSQGNGSDEADAEPKPPAHTRAEFQGGGVDGPPSGLWDGPPPEPPTDEDPQEDLDPEDGRRR